MVRSETHAQAGFTLLEVLVAFAILAMAVVSLIELTAQGLRLLKLSGDHQQALLLADRIARQTQVSADDTTADSLDGGQEGNFAWERRITRLALPEEFEPKTPAPPGKELPGLYTVAVAVRWGRNQTVEVATLRAPTAPASATPAEQTSGGVDTQPPVRGPGPQGSTAGSTGAAGRPAAR